MGACNCNAKKPEKSEKQKLIEEPLNIQTQQKQKNGEAESQQFKIIAEQNLEVIEDKREEAKMEQNQNTSQKFDEDIFVNDIMKQFDDLNNLLNQMAKEFDQMSQYLQSMSAVQECK